MYYFSIQAYLLGGENVGGNIYIYSVHQRLQTQIAVESENSIKRSEVGWV